MAALDTNILVRFLVRDDRQQAATATRLILSSIDKGLPLYIPVSVLVELEWVLRTQYRFDKPRIIETISNLLSSIELTFQDEQAMTVALSLFVDSSADFADCIHIALASYAGALPLWTFDRKAAKVAGARLLV